MSNEPQKPPIPALNYYPDPRSPALDILVRLVLLTTAGYACCAASSDAAGILGGWPPISASLNAVITVGLIAIWLVFAASCIGVATINIGRLPTICSAFAVIPLDAWYYIRLDFSNPPMTFSNWIQMTAGILSDGLFPALVVVILLRADMRLSR